MKFFARLTFICNVCFIIAVVLRAVEMGRRKSGNYEQVIPLPAIEGTLVILGYGAILLNVFYVLITVIRLLARKQFPDPSWLTWFNLLLFPVQVWFHFFYQ